MTSSFVRASSLALFSLLALSLGGCKHKPCGGDGMAVDARPLPAAWASHMAVPEGATMCWAPNSPISVESPTSTYFSRHWDVPAKTTADAVAKWEATLTAKGWTKLPPTKGDFEDALRPGNCIFKNRYEQAGAALDVSVSACAKGDPGWSTLGFNVVAPKR
jgi:hypothetical protein